MRSLQEMKPETKKNRRHMGHKTKRIRQGNVKSRKKRMDEPFWGDGGGDIPGSMLVLRPEESSDKLCCVSVGCRCICSSEDAMMLREQCLLRGPGQVSW